MQIPIQAGLLVIGLTCHYVHAQETNKLTVEQRLERMENELQELRKENQELKRKLGLDGKTSGLISVKPAGKEPILKVGGLIQAQADFGDKGDSRFATRNDRFYLRRARINASGTFLEDFDYKVELDLSGTLAETSALRAQATDAYVQWTRFDEANVRAGQFKTPFGFEQLYRDPYLLTIERSLPNDRLTWSRQLGVQLSGDFFERRLSYAGGVFNGNGANNSFNDGDEFMYIGRLSGIPWQGKVFGQDASCGLGANVYYSDDASVPGLNDFGFDSTPATPAIDSIFVGIRKGMGADAQLQVGPFELWAEYLRSRFNPSNGIPLTELDAEGGYVQGACYILPKRLQAVVKYDMFDPNTDASGDSTDTWTLGLNYYFKGHDLKLQLNYLLADSPGVAHRQSKFLLRIQTIF